ncbi:hypothetical protein D3C85_1183750 [compost metagenome]
MKYAIIGLLAVILTGCNQLVGNPDDLIQKIQKCQSIGMDAVLLIGESTAAGDIKVKCKEKTK